MNGKILNDNKTAPFVLSTVEGLPTEFLQERAKKFSLGFRLLVFLGGRFLSDR